MTRTTRELVDLTAATATGNPWIDAGLAVLLAECGPGMHAAADVAGWLTTHLIGPAGGQSASSASGSNRPTGKVGWKPPASAVVNITSPGGRPLAVPLKSARSGTCELCGQTGRVADAAMAFLPMVVASKNFVNFASGTRRGLQVCLRCMAAGYAAYLGCLWWRRGPHCYMFLLHGLLDQMRQLYRTYIGPARAGAWSLSPAFGGDGPSEVTWGLILTMFRAMHARDPQADAAAVAAIDEVHRLLGLSAPAAPEAPISLIVLAVTKVGRAPRVRQLSVISHLPTLYELYKAWIQELEHDGVTDAHDVLTGVFGQLVVRTRGGNSDTRWRERVAREIIHFGDPFPFVEEFVFELASSSPKGKRLAIGTTTVVDVYAREVFAMAQELIDRIASYGYRLGRVAAEQQKMSLLYDLRNARSIEAYLEVINNAQFQLQLPVPKELTDVRGESIGGVPWQRVKSLVAIHAMNAYLYHQKGGGSDGERN